MFTIGQVCSQGTEVIIGPEGEARAGCLIPVKAEWATRTDNPPHIPPFLENHR